MRAILPQSTGQRVVTAVALVVLAVILVAVLKTVTADHSDSDARYHDKLVACQQYPAADFDACMRWWPNYPPH